METREIAWVTLSVLCILLVGIYFTGFGSDIGRAIFFGEESGVFSFVPSTTTYTDDTVLIFRPDPQVEIDGLGISGRVSGVGDVSVRLVYDNTQYVIDEFQVNNEEISFGASCVATCDLSAVEMDSDRYLIVLEISSGVVLELDGIIYSTSPLSEALASIEIADVSVGSIALSTVGVSDLNAQGASQIYCGDELIVSGDIASGYYCDEQTIVYYNNSGVKQVSFGGQTVESTIYEDVNVSDVIVSFEGESSVRDVNGKKEIQVDLGNNRMILEDVLNLAEVESVNVKIEPSEFSTPLIAVHEELVIDRAIITLEKTGPVDTIFYCPNFDFEASTCPFWQETDLGFADNGETISFEVSSFSAYAGGEGSDVTFDSQDVTYTDLNSCGTISVSGAYRLINDVSSSGTCFTITADDVLFNGDDHTITYAQSVIGDGIKVISSDRVNIIDSRLSTSRTNSEPSAGAVLAGINMVDSNQGLIFNNTFSITGDYDTGVFLSNLSSTQVRNNTIQISGFSSSAIELRKCKVCAAGEDATPSLFNNVIAGNIIVAQDTSSGIESYSSSGTLIEFNKITLLGSGSDEGVFLRHSSDTVFSNNEVQSTGIALHVSQSNRSIILNNILSSSVSPWNGIRLSPVDRALIESNVISAVSHAAFLNGAHRVIFRNNQITSSSATGVYVSGISSAITNNTFIANDISGSARDFLIANLVRQTNFIDQAIGTYQIHGASGLFFENTNFGSLQAEGNAIYGGDLVGSLDSDVVIQDNYVNFQFEVSNPSFPYGFSEGNITLYGIGDRGFINPVILRNGVVCGACVALTSLTAQDVSFTIPAAGEYSIGEGFIPPSDETSPIVTLLAPPDDSVVQTPFHYFAANFTDDVDLSYATFMVWNKVTHELLHTQDVDLFVNKEFVSDPNETLSVGVFAAEEVPFGGGVDNLISSARQPQAPSTASYVHFINAQSDSGVGFYVAPNNESLTSLINLTLWVYGYSPQEDSVHLRMEAENYYDSFSGGQISSTPQWHAYEFNNLNFNEDEAHSMQVVFRPDSNIGGVDANTYVYAAYIEYTASKDFANVSYTLPYYGEFEWNYEAFDTSDNSAFAPQNWTIIYEQPYDFNLTRLIPTQNYSEHPQHSKFDTLFNLSCTDDCGELNTTLYYGNRTQILGSEYNLNDVYLMFDPGNPETSAGITRKIYSTWDVSTISDDPAVARIEACYYGMDPASLVASLANPSWSESSTLNEMKAVPLGASQPVSHTITSVDEFGTEFWVCIDITQIYQQFEVSGNGLFSFTLDTLNHELTVSDAQVVIDEQGLRTAGGTGYWFVDREGIHPTLDPGYAEYTPYIKVIYDGIYPPTLRKIPTTPGATPFFVTNSSNPQISSLNNEDVNITFNLNATAAVNTTWELVAIANDLAGNWAWSYAWFEKITQPKPILNLTKWLPLGQTHETPQNQNFLAQFNTSCSGDCEDVNVTLAYGSRRQVINDALADVFIVSDDSNGEWVLQRRTFEKWDISEIDSNTPILNLTYCSFGTLFTEQLVGYLVDPSWDESSSVQTIRSLAHSQAVDLMPVQIVVSEFEVPSALICVDITELYELYLQSDYSTFSFALDNPAWEVNLNTAYAVFDGTNQFGDNVGLEVSNWLVLEDREGSLYGTANTPYIEVNYERIYPASVVDVVTLPAGEPFNTPINPFEYSNFADEFVITDFITNATGEIGTTWEMFAYANSSVEGVWAVSESWFETIIPSSGDLVLEVIIPEDFTGRDVPQDELFEVKVNVTCLLADCGLVNVSLAEYGENYSDPQAVFSGGHPQWTDQDFGFNSYSTLAGILNKGVRSSQVPDLSTYVIGESIGGDPTISLPLNMTGGSLLHSPTAVRVWVYAETLQADGDLYAQINGVNGMLIDSQVAPKGWYYADIDADLTQEQLENGMDLRLILAPTGPGLSTYVYALYAEFLYEPVPPYLVPTFDTTPLYTSTNPYEHDFVAGETRNFSWYVNASGDVGTIRGLYAFATDKEEPQVNSYSEYWNVSITKPIYLGNGPVVNLLHPENDSKVTNPLVWFAANVSDTPPALIVNGTLMVWDNSTNALVHSETLYNFVAFGAFGLLGEGYITSYTLPYEGVFEWNYNVTNDYGVSAFNATNFTIEYYIPDTTPPEYDNLTRHPDPAVYAPAQNYEFNITVWDESGVAFVIFDFNGVNYSVSPNIGDVYTLNLNGLDAGTYTYKVWMNDTLGNSDVTPDQTYEIAKATPALNLVVSSGGVYPTSVTAAGTNCPAELTCELYENSVLISNPRSATLNVGTYDYVYSTSGNQNYNPASVSDSIEITPGATNLELYINGQQNDVTTTYLTPTTIYTQGSNGDVVLTINGIDVTASENDTTLIRNAGTYTVVATLTPHANYAPSQSVTYTLTVDKAPSSCNINSNTPVGYPASTLVSGSCDNPEAGYDLYRDGVEVNSENGVLTLLPVGTYNYEVNVSETTNYLSASAQTSVVVAIDDTQFWPNLEIEIVDDVDPINAGSVVKYTIIVTNTGNETASGIELANTIPDQGTISATSPVFTSPVSLGTLLAGESVELNVSVLVDPLTLGQITINDTVYVTYANDSGPTDVSATEFTLVRNDAGSSDLEVDLLFPSDGEIKPDEPVTFIYSVYGDGIHSCRLWSDESGGFAPTTAYASANEGVNAIENLNFADGTYLWNVECRSYAGYTYFAPYNYTFSIDSSITDDLAPVVDLIFPEDGAVKPEGQIALVYRVEDNYDPQCRLWSDINGAFEVTQDWVSVSEGVNSFTENFAAGSYEWNVECVDASGNNAFANANFNLIIDASLNDNNAPIVDLLLPLDGEIKPAGEIDFVYRVEDDYDPFCSLWTNISGNFAETRPAVGVSEGINAFTQVTFSETGEYRWNVYCVDGSGNGAFAPEDFTLFIDASIIDLEAPVVTLVAPENGEIKPAGGLDFIYRVEDNYDPECRLWSDVNGDWAVSRSYEAVPEGLNGFANLYVDTSGEYTWNVECIDGSGNSAFARENWTVIVDTSIVDDIPPFVELLAPENATTKPEGNIDFIYRVEDNYDPECRLWTNATGDFIVSRSFTPVPEGVNGFGSFYMTHGEYIWNVECVDVAGNSGFANANFTLYIDSGIVDNEPPSVELLAPEDGAVKPAGEIDFIYSVDDNYDPQCRLWSDISGTFSVTRSFEPVAEGVNDFLDVYIENSGTYRWNVECIDGSGNSAFAPNDFTLIIDASIVDDEAPVVNLVTPEHLSTVPPGFVDLVYEVNDNYDPECRLYFNSTGDFLVERSFEGVVEGTNSWNNIPVSEGSYLWNVECEDGSGNRANATTNYIFNVGFILAESNDVLVSEGIFEPLCCADGTTGESATCDSSNDVSCESGLPLVGSHNNEFIITIQNVTSSGGVHACTIMQSNGDSLVLSGTHSSVTDGELTLNYVVSNQSNEIIDRTIPWRIAGCDVNGVDLTLNSVQPIYVHRNSWSLFTLDTDDASRALDCYASLPYKYFNNTVKCTVEGDVNYAISKAKGFTLQDGLLCHDGIDNYGSGLDCADLDCSGMQYFSCPDTTQYFDNHPFLSGQSEIGGGGLFSLTGNAILDYSIPAYCNPDTNICSGVLNLGSRNVPYKYTLSATPDGTLKVMFLHGSVSTTQFMADYITNTAPPFSAVGKYARSGGVTLPDDETSIGVYSTRFAGGSTFSGIVDQVMYLTLDNAPQTSYGLQILANFEGAQDTQETNRLFISDDEAPSNWDENDPALPHDIEYIYGTITSNHACNDDEDNDLDFTFDCKDTQCVNVQIGETLAGDAISCEAVETSCWDGFDNDGDGAVDCADLDCNGRIGAYMDGDTPQKYFIANAEVAYCEYSSSAEGTQFYGESLSSCQDNFNNDADAGNQWNDFSCDGSYEDCRGSQIDCFDAYSCWARSGSDAGICPQFEASCSDGIDNDYDVDLQGSSNNWKNIYVPDPRFDATGADCDDYDCSAVLDGSGNVVCSASPSEVTEWDGVNNETCFDGIDNDLDAYIWDGSNYVENPAGGFDCNDSQCLFVKNPNDPTDQCLPKEFSLGEYNLCYDNVDNDYDTRASCIDNTGDGTATNVNSLSGTDCWAGFQACGPCPAVEDYLYNSCADGIDNDLDDGNGGYGPGAAGLDCSDLNCAGELATYSGSMCGAENTPAQCSDGKDNDGDGQIDAQDASCAGIIAGGVLQVSETSCNDGFDNDQDGRLDCADSSCYGVGSCIDPATDWSKGSYCGVVPQYTTAYLASANPTIDYTHQRRDYINSDYSLQFSGSSNYESVTFFIGSCSGSEFSYDLNSCSVSGADASSFDLLIDPSCNAARLRSNENVANFEVALTCEGKTTPQDASYDLAVSAEKNGELEYGEKTPLTTWHETLGPNILGIQVGGIAGSNGGSLSLAYGSDLGIIAQPENDPSGICSCIIDVDGSSHTTANTCTYIEQDLTSEGNVGIDARARDGSANIGPTYSIAVDLELTPIETTPSFKLNRAFYRENITTLNTGIFSFATAEGDSFGDCSYSIEDQNGNIVHSQTGSSSGNNLASCSTTLTLPSAVVSTDGVYFVKASVTDSDLDSVLSKGKIFYVCNDLTSSGTTPNGMSWTCAKADLDNDGETEGTYTTVYNSLGPEYENLACDTCPEVTNWDQDLNGNGIDDACDDAFSGTSCTPNWSCSDWSSCSGGEETRSCVDLNGCGDPSGMPPETQSCSSCTEEWSCSDFGSCENGLQQRTCVEVSSCGTTNDMPSEIQSCGSSVTNYARSSGNGNALCIEGVYAKGANRTLTPGDLTLEEGRVLLIEPLALDCSASDITVSVPLGYTDYLVHRCRGESCDVVSGTQVDELLCNTEVGIYRNNTRFTNEFIPDYSVLNVPISTIRANEVINAGGVEIEGEGSGSIGVRPVQGTLLQPVNPTLTLAGVPIEISTQGSVGSSKIVLKYLETSPVDEATIQAYVWSEGAWKYIGGSLDIEDNTVSLLAKEFEADLINGKGVIALIGKYCEDCENKLSQLYNNGNLALVLINGPGSSPGAYQALVNDITLANHPIDVYLYDAYGGVSKSSKELANLLSQLDYDSAVLVGEKTSGVIAEQTAKYAYDEEMDLRISDVVLVGTSQRELKAENVKDVITAIVNTESFASVFIDGTVRIGNVDQVPGVQYRRILKEVQTDSVAEDILENKDGVIGPNNGGEACVDYFEVPLTKETLLEEKYTREVILSIASEALGGNGIEGETYIRTVVNDCVAGDYIIISGIESEDNACLAGESEVSIISVLFAILLGLSILFFIYFAGKEVITLIQEKTPKGKARIAKIEKDIKSVNSRIKKL